MVNENQIGLFAAFLATGVEFVVVGGVAVNVHGYLRSTYDLDIFIRPTIPNAEATFRALERFGAPLRGLKPTDLLDDEEHFRFKTANEHIDVLASIGEMTFDEAWMDRVEVETAGMRVPFISKSRLIENKRQTGRLRDLVDVEESERLPDR